MSDSHPSCINVGTTGHIDYGVAYLVKVVLHSLGIYTYMSHFNVPKIHISIEGYKGGIDE